MSAPVGTPVEGRVPVLKPLRWPRFWLGLWIAALVATWITCLLPVHDLPPLDVSDKFEHGFGYFVLCVSGLQVFNGWKRWWWVFAGLVLMGIGVEVAQGVLTLDREADPYDALANGCGAAAGLLIGITPLRDALLKAFPARR